MGFTNVICIDKTGTLTLNMMEIEDKWIYPNVNKVKNPN